jgi:PAS domain S-box-containing protein
MGAPPEAAVDVAQAAHSYEQLRLAIEAAPTGMLIVNDRGLITFVNAQVEKLFGYGRHELLGRSAEMLVPERLRARHAPPRSLFTSSPHAHTMGTGGDMYGLRKNGTEVPVEIGLNPLDTPTGSFVLSSIVDITERKRAAELLAESLHEKETLLREIHHRVKNNLQVVSSLLSLQSHHLADEPTRAAFAQSQSRVHSIALVHEKLYQAADLSRINFTDYARELTDHLIHVQGAEERGIRCTVGESDLRLAVDTCIACGLVVNELVTNSIKHAFPGRSAGNILVSFEKCSGQLELTVSDDGIGLPVTVDLTRVKTLGLDLVTAFAARLKADVQVKRQLGTSFMLRFVER